jgi:hypothetical protein
MVALAKLFEPAIINCQEVIGSGSCLLVGKVPNCGEEPVEYTFEAVAAVAASTVPTTIQVRVTATNQDGAAVVIASPSFVVRENSFLTFGTTTVKVLNRAVITGVVGGVAVSVESVPTAIAAAATGTTWGLELLETVTDLPLDASSTDADRKDLKSGIQGSKIKTRIDLDLNITYFASPLDLAQTRIMLPAGLGTENIFFVAAKSSGLTAFGRAIVMGMSESGTDDIVTYSTTLSAQAPFAIVARTADPLVNTTAQLTALNNVLRLSGLKTV